MNPAALSCPTASVPAAHSVLVSVTMTHASTLIFPRAATVPISQHTRSTMPSTPAPLFYFPSAATLLQYDHFTVEKDGDAWAVYGTIRNSDRVEIVAEFPHRRYAELFAEIVERLANSTTIMSSFFSDLTALGFGDPDTDVSGGDAVDVIGQHFPYLRTIPVN